MSGEPSPVPDESGAGLDLRPRARGGARWQAVTLSWVLPLLVIAAIAGPLAYVALGHEGSEPDTAGNQGTLLLSREPGETKLGAETGSAARVGQLAPDFTLLDLDGNLVSLSAFRGQTVVINFWATWCESCRREFPDLVDVYAESNINGLVVLSVDFQEDPASVRKFANEFAVRFPLVIDADGSVASRYRIEGLPVTWFVDSQGVLRDRVIGTLTRGRLRSGLRQADFVPAESR